MSNKDFKLLRLIINDYPELNIINHKVSDIVQYF